MKIANIDNNNKLLGWYDTDIHDNIPTPNVEVTDEQWNIALSEGHNKVNEDGSTEIFDFRSEEEVQEDFETNFRAERDALLSQCDININIAEDNNEDSYTLRAYRQALRDATIDWVLPEL